MKSRSEQCADLGEINIQAAEHLFDGSFYPHAVFYAHQACEMYLLACLAKKGQSVERITSHFLDRMGTFLHVDNNTQQKLKKISPTYVFARYPKNWSFPLTVYQKENTRQIIDDTYAIITWAKKQLNT